MYGDRPFYSFPRSAIASLTVDDVESRQRRNQMSDLEQALNTFYADYAEEYTQALSLLKPLAEKENAEAQCIIGNIYHLGLSVERNILEAIKWYIKAAENGNAVAANNLAGIYLSGDEGVAVNQAEAYKWFEIARKQGFLHTPVSNDYLKLAAIV